MLANDNPHAKRLYDSLISHNEQAAAEEIARENPLSKTANAAAKFAWAQGICESLESDFSQEVIKDIRNDCACGPANSRSDKLRKIYRASDNLDDFAAKAAAQEHGYTILHEDGALFLVYPKCYCSCVKDVDEPVPTTWCYCTLGYTKRLFERVLERPVTAELIESVKTGGERCKIKVAWLDTAF